MNVKQYQELVNELNFYDLSVGIEPITLHDEEVIKEILIDFNYIPIGYYESINSKGYKFKDDEEVYAIQEVKDNLEVVKLIEL